MQYKRPESVLVLVYTQQAEVLMLRRKFPSHFWQSVTGSLEWDETPEQAAWRELFEETGLKNVDLFDCQSSQTFKIYEIWRERYAPNVTENLEHVFAVKLDDRCKIVLDPREHVEYTWMSKQKAIETAFSHTNQDAIEKWVR